jgi:hypothetical protein
VRPLCSQGSALSPLSLCWHNKTLLPAKLPQHPVSQLEIPETFLEGSWGIVETVTCHLPCRQGASPRLSCANRQFDPEESLILPASQGEGLGRTTKPSEGQEAPRGVLPITLVRTWFWTQAWLRRQMGRLITSQRAPNNPICGETGSLSLTELGKSVWDTSKS